MSRAAGSHIPELPTYGGARAAERPTPFSTPRMSRACNEFLATGQSSRSPAAQSSRSRLVVMRSLSVVRVRGELVRDERAVRRRPRCHCTGSQRTTVLRGRARAAGGSRSVPCARTPLCAQQTSGPGETVLPVLQDEWLQDDFGDVTNRKKISTSLDSRECKVVPIDSDSLRLSRMKH